MVESEWLNSPGPYVQYTYDVDPRLVAIIRRHGFAFDDRFWYWIPKTKRGKELPMLMIKRAPLWIYPHKSLPAEKSNRKKAEKYFGQKRLELEAVS
jgi:hypothetical protein